VPDLRKVQQAIGYRPRYTLDDIIRDVAAYLSGKMTAGLFAH
jgi:nucleoside-diphosphate-sugar epimerase